MSTCPYDHGYDDYLADFSYKLVRWTATDVKSGNAFTTTMIGLAKGASPAGHGRLRIVDSVGALHDVQPDRVEVVEVSCLKCEEAITIEQGVGWVCTTSGDDGGTYDYCEVDFGKHVPTTTSIRKVN